MIGRHLDAPFVSIAPEDAVEHFGWIGTIWALNALTSNTITRQPTGPGLIQDLEDGHYFQAE